MVITRALPNYSQVEYREIQIKRRKTSHMEEDGGCGCTWFTVKLPEDDFKMI